MSLETAVQNLADAIRYAADKQPGAIPAAPSKDKVTPIRPPAAAATAAATTKPAAPKAPPVKGNGKAAPADATAPLGEAEQRAVAKALVMKLAASKGRETAVALLTGVQEGVPNVAALDVENLQPFIDAANSALEG